MKKELPILFSTAMVQAILARRKTMTRREVAKRNSHSTIAWDDIDWSEVYVNKPVGLKVKKKGEDTLWRISPRYQVGDILYVRETWAMNSHGEIAFRADGEEFKDGDGFTWIPNKWKPGIHLLKKHSRIWASSDGYQSGKTAGYL
jgi:hypothetical protein